MSQVIRSTLEKELTLLNKSRLASLEMTEGAAHRQQLLNDAKDASFRWADFGKTRKVLYLSAGNLKFLLVFLV